MQSQRHRNPRPAQLPRAQDHDIDFEFSRQQESDFIHSTKRGPATVSER